MYSWRVPPNVYGRLKVVARSDLGGLGPAEGRPTELTVRPSLWAWLDIVWLLGVTGLVIRKRISSHLLTILLPVLGVFALWIILSPILGIEGDPEPGLLLDVTLGLAVIGFASMALATLRWYWRIIVCATILLAVCVFAVGSYRGHLDPMGYLVYVGGVISVLISAVAVRFGIRCGFTWYGAIIWLAIGSIVGWMVLGGGLLVLGLFLGQPATISQTAMAGFIVKVAGAIFTVTLPFFGLAIISRFWRARLLELLGLPAVGSAAEDTHPGHDPGQDPQ